MRKLFLLLLVFVLVACGQSVEEETDKPNETVSVGGGAGEYSILMPFKISPLRQEYANNYRETDLMEMGRGLIEESKEFFSTKTYSIGEGSVITPKRYYELLGRESESNVYGLNKEGNLELEDGTVLERPQYISNIVELNFHKTNNREQVDGVSVALVMKRIQILDATIGSTTRLTDDVLYQVGIPLGQQLHSYLRTLEGMGDIPIYISLYVQESDQDTLPGKYLPGHFIGHAFFESARSGDFVRTNTAWEMLNSETVLKQAPKTYSDFSEIKRNLTKFMGDESVGIVGKGLMDGSKVKEIQIEVTTGPKTYLELMGLAEAMKKDLSLFDDLGVKVNVNIKIFQNTRMVISKLPNEEATFIHLN